MTSSSQKRNRTHKGKAPAEESFLLGQQRGLNKFLIIQDTLVQDVKWWCLKKRFHARPVLSPKVMHTPFFAAPGFEFQNLMNWQGLQPFL